MWRASALCNGVNEKHRRNGLSPAGSSPGARGAGGRYTTGGRGQMVPRGGGARPGPALAEGAAGRPSIM